MAIKQRTLTYLSKSMKSLMTATCDNFDISLFQHGFNNFLSAQKECQKGLTEANYKKYAEIFNGLNLSFNDLINMNVSDNFLDKSQITLIDLSIELLNYLINELKNEEHFKREIVFLPVQSSMWDSMESVWQAAYEDTERTIAYVIPIPYDNLDEEGNVKERVCEINKFPKYVPVIDYNDIDLFEMHPEVIIKNNPYDDLNLITRIDERYFTLNLKKCADKLVYIPYFILNEKVTKETKLTNSFVVNYGVVYSDLVCVQSEDMKKQYIDILIKETPWKDRNYWEKRIIATGSPKVDKLQTTIKNSDIIEDANDLPKKWRKKIKGKKVILYLTSFKNQEINVNKICPKMKYVFNIFKNRKDTVLWWRPHPLLKQAMDAMFPFVKEEYLKLEREFIEEDWGIYDDSGDLHRAIAYSDAYYGDPSSVLELYKYTGKPILLQNMLCTD